MWVGENRTRKIPNQTPPGAAEGGEHQKGTSCRQHSEKVPHRKMEFGFWGAFLSSQDRKSSANRSVVNKSRHGRDGDVPLKTSRQREGPEACGKDHNGDVRSTKLVMYLGQGRRHVALFG